ncbi:MAG TPA: queuosine precursor transporter [Steroidobacter sp.]
MVSSADSSRPAPGPASQAFGLAATAVVEHPVDNRPAKLFIVLAAFLVCNAIIAEFVGVKIFALEPTLGLQPLNWNLFGQSGSLSFTSGVLLWPFVFLMTDIINEYFGTRGVRFISWLTVVLIVYGFIAAYMAISLTPAGFWVAVNSERGVPDMQAAFSNIFGQGMWTIAGSITAFLVGQLIDVAVFHRIRMLTGERWIWLRATGSTAVSQLVDSFVVLYIAFVIGPQKWPMSLFLAVASVNYAYKLLMAFLLIPLIYVTRLLIRGYLGAKTSEQLQEAAARVS